MGIKSFLSPQKTISSYLTLQPGTYEKVKSPYGNRRTYKVTYVFFQVFPYFIVIITV